MMASEAKKIADTLTEQTIQRIADPLLQKALTSIKTRANARKYCCDILIPMFPDSDEKTAIVRVMQTLRGEYGYTVCEKGNGGIGSRWIAISWYHPTK